MPRAAQNEGQIVLVCRSEQAKEAQAVYGHTKELIAHITLVGPGQQVFPTTSAASGNGNRDSSPPTRLQGVG